MSYKRKSKEHMLMERMRSYKATNVEVSGPMYEAEGDPFPENFKIEVLTELARTV
jgi:hypothetical protein